MAGALGHRSGLLSAPAGHQSRLQCSSGATQRCSRRQHACQAAHRPQGGADGHEPRHGGESVDAEWQRVRLQPLWRSLDAQLEQCWVEQGGAVEDAAAAPATEDTWDQLEGDAFSSASSLPAMGSLAARGGVDTLWPLAARTAAFSSSGGQQNWLQELSQVYVILFGVGSTDTEGIYSLRVMSRDDGLPQDTIIAFSSKEDAERYSGLLEATMEHVPSVCPIEPTELLDFCADSGYSYRVEAIGSLLIPPDYYVGITDWERSLRLREGKWTVMERDLTKGLHPSDGTGTFAMPAAEPPMSNNASYYPMSESSYLLEEARARLERLLPRDC